MESRKIIIVDSATGGKFEILTDATTFGELQSAARAAGINYAGKDWLEGLTKTVPTSEDSLLPTNVNYRGTTTNNLVYMLTNTNKQIKSGMTRSELYDAFKTNPAWKAEFQAANGRNFTNAASTMLEEFVNGKLGACTCSREAGTSSDAYYKEKYDNLVYAVSCLLLTINDEVSSDIETVYNALYEETQGPKEVKFTDSDIADLFK